MLSEIELCWLDVETDIIEKLRIHILNSEEEGSEFINDVVKEVVQDHVSSDSLWTLIEVLIVFRDSFESIIGPVK